MNKIGALISFRPDTDIEAKFKEAAEMGCECCQVTVWDTELYTNENAAALKAASEKWGVEISTLWTGWSGPKVWNAIAGPSTLGIVPPAYRFARINEILEGAEFAVKLGVSRIATHVGFLPENFSDPEKEGILAALKHIVERCKQLGISFLFETGQETPMTLLRFIEDIGTDNVGINMDTANLIIYGKANSADAITVFGKYVMDTHIKDAVYTTSGREHGKEVKVGEGMANIPEVIKRLKAVGYTGNYIVEREISGDEQKKDIADTLEFLRKILRGDEKNA